MKYKLGIKEIIKAVMHKLCADNPHLEGKEAEIAIKTKRLENGKTELTIEVEVVE